MQIGETLSAVQELMQDGKCIICDSDIHPDPKREEIAEVAPNDKSKWGRVSMTGVFDWTDKKKVIYLNGASPRYATQGHHCLALSALVTDANTDNRKDRRLRLNHFLNKSTVGFYPNRKQNCILLPARKGYGDFDAFWDSLDDNKPLQLHGPGHDENYFTQCDRMLSILVLVITDPDICADEDTQGWEKDLKDLIEKIENYCFVKLASNDMPWRLHPDEQHRALTLYFLPQNQTYNVLGIGKVQEGRNGLGKAQKPIVFPSPDLEMGQFNDY